MNPQLPLTLGLLGALDEYVRRAGVILIVALGAAMITVGGLFAVQYPRLLLAVLIPVVIFYFFEITLKIILPKGITEPLFIPLYKMFF